VCIKIFNYFFGVASCPGSKNGNFFHSVLVKIGVLYGLSAGDLPKLRFFVVSKGFMKTGFENSRQPQHHYLSLYRAKKHWLRIKRLVQREIR
jgi:hypothetical protein